MKKIKALLVLLVVLMGVVFLPACFKKEESQPDKNEIVFADEYEIPNVRIGKEYDFEPYFTKQKDTDYTMTAVYLDDDLNEVSLDVDGFKFVQNEMSNVFVTITATKGSVTYSGEIELPIDTTADDTDFWVYDSLFAGTGMSKSLNYYTQYRNGEDSLTSVKFTYKGVAKKNSPISAIPFIDWPSNSRLTVTDWSNAVIVFDVYNSSEKNITFGFIIKHSSGISYSFDQCQKFVCEPNKWTRIEYSLKALNLTEKFVFNAEYDLSDHIIAQVVYGGAPEANEENPKAYSYNFFVDNVDICNYSESRFPNLDTTTYKEYEDFFTKDDALSLVVNYDYENSKKTEDLYCYDKLVEYSNKSIKVVLSENGESAQAFLHSFIGGNPMGWKPLDISNAVMSFYVSVKNADTTFDLRFESDDNIFAEPITIDLTKTSGDGWTVENTGDGWYKVTVTVSETNAENALVRMDFIRTMRLYFTNQTATQGEESAIYLDSLTLSGHKITEIMGDEKLSWETKSPYTSQEENDMFSKDDNLVLTVNGERVEKDESANIHDASTKSNYSYRLNLSETGENTATATVDSFFTGTPSDWTILDISNATITFDVKVINANTVFSVAFASDFNDYGLILGKKLVIDLASESGDGWSVAELDLGWYRVTLDIKNADITDDEVGITKDFIKIMRMEFNNSTAEAGVTSSVAIDNLSVEGAVATSATLDEEKPWETKSPYVNYTIKFLNSDGSVISEEIYHYGDTVTVPETPTMSGMDKEGQFSFAGWDYEVTKVNGHATYKATYTGTIIDLWNCEIENGGIDGLTYDTSAVNGESNRSLKVSEPITSGNLPNLVIVLDKTYDLTNKYIVFDINFTKDGWLFGFDFVNDGNKNTPWNMHTIKKGETSPSHKCEDLGNGWVRVYVEARVLNATLDKVSKIYFTINASDGSGTLEFNLDNLHFEDIPEVETYVITFKDYDGRVISSEEYEEGATVVVPSNPTRSAVANECEYEFAGWDYEVTVAEADATYTATYNVINVVDMFNCKIENGGIDGLTYDTSAVNGESNRSLKVSEPITSGNLPNLVIVLDKTYDLTNKYIVFDINFTKDGWLFGFDFVNDGNKNTPWNMHTIKKGETSPSHKCEDLGNGWVRVYVEARVLNATLDKVSKIYFTINASDGEGTLEFNLDNLHFEEKIDRIEDCGLVAVNGGTFTYDSVNGYAVANVPENNSNVWWNYDVDLTKLLGKGLNLDGKTITFDVKIVGNMTWVGFTVADGYGSYFKPNDEDYAWMNLSNGWSGFDMTITAIEDGWFRVSLAPSSTFASVKENVGKLRFLVNPQDANEASFLIDNLYLGELVGYVEPAKTDIIDECGLVAVNGGTFVYDSANGYAVATVPANNSGVYWNYDIGLTDITDEAVNLSGKTISFDVKIVGNMTWVGFTVGYGNGNYAQVNNEGYAWTNLSDKWSGYGMSINALEDGWFRVTVTIDESFSSVSSNITELRFLVSPQDANEATFSVDNLYL